MAASLDDKYLLEQGRVFFSGTQALVRVLLDQRRRDRSEERRGGEEGRSRGGPGHLKKKDGIGDVAVTGVETCALPICICSSRAVYFSPEPRRWCAFCSISAGGIDRKSGGEGKRGDLGGGPVI